MARYDDKANTGYGGVFFDTEGREHAVVGYAEAQKYVATTEQVYEYKKGLGKGHGIRDITPPRRPSPNDWPLKDDGFSTKVHDPVRYGQNSKGSHGQSKGSPRSKDAYESSRFISPPSKDHYYNTREIGKNNEFSDDEDDVICENGVCYEKGGSRPINHPKQEDYGKEKHRGNSYAPKKDSYYEKPYGTNEKPKGSTHVPSSYTVPVTIPTRIDPYYETSTQNNNRPIVNGPKPIQTRLGPEFPNENRRNSSVSIGMQQPQYDGSPRKNHGYDQSIYNKASPPTGAYAGHNYKGITIDAKEAAKKYKGVLLTN